MASKKKAGKDDGSIAENRRARFDYEIGDTLECGIVLVGDIRLRTRKSFILEIQPIDLFAYLASYFFARDYLRERGFKICLDGLNHLSVPLLRRDDLGFDFVNVQWSSETLRDQPPGRREQLADAIRSVGAARVILCRCDDEQAVSFGHAVGISLFQGRHIDRLLTQ